MKTRLLELSTSIMALISPKFREILSEYVLQLEKRAKETDNPFDDIAVYVVKVILGL